MENIRDIDKSKFKLIQLDEKIHDTKFETKAIGYFGDALRRFSRNKSSVVAFIILCTVIFLAIFAPMVSKYDIDKINPRLQYLSPRIPILEKLGILNGYKTYNVQVSTIVNPEDDSYSATKVANKEQYDTSFIVKYGEKTTVIQNGTEYEYQEIVYDTYKFHAQPYVKLNVTSSEFERLNAIEGAILEIRAVKGIVGEEAEYDILIDPAVAEDFSTKTYYVFGTDALGRDMWTLVWKGSRTSLIIGLFVAVVTITIGIIWGSVSGYYGGTIDLVMERFTEVLGGIPWLVIMTLMKLYFGGSVLTVAIALVLTSWIGTASTVRSQFYRYKGREYVLASRTLGARDRRLIFKHILPNALGPIVTSSVLIIPSAIFFESTVSYLGIGVTSDTSIGNLLSSGQSLVTTYPHLTIAPALIISILMITFNLFGNGLRDALNPTLRGAE